MKNWKVIILVIVGILILATVIYFWKDLFPSKASSDSQETPIGTVYTFPLRIGSNGLEVEKLQAKLNSEGQNLVVDGKFGPLTAAALQAVYSLTSVSEAFYNSTIV